MFGGRRMIDYSRLERLAAWLLSEHPELVQVFIEEDQE
jgi:hypothetical protein